MGIPIGRDERQGAFANEAVHALTGRYNRTVFSKQAARHVLSNLAGLVVDFPEKPTS